MTVLATIILLGVLIFIHELGHFGAAKLVGVEVQRFSIGLGPRIFGFKWGETEYVFSAIPLGGYVKMGGMEDEVMEMVEGGKGAPPRVPGPRDFDGKPIWARTLVISAGVIMNMIFAFTVYSFVAGVWGVRDVASTRVGAVLAQYLPEGTEDLTQLPTGAEITTVGGQAVEKWGDVGLALVQAEAGPLAIQHQNPSGVVEVRVPSSEEDRIRMAMTLRVWVDAAVGRVEPGSPAEKGGIENGDQILSIDGTPIVNWYDFLDVVHARPGARAEVRLLREGRELTRVVNLDTQEVDDPITGDRVTQGRIGIYIPSDDYIYTRIGFTQAMVVGYRETVAVTALILGFLKDLVTGGVSPRSVGSIVTIGEASGEAASMGLDFFLRFMALFSVNLAVLNLLPIPVLDGGHLVFLAIEALRGGKALSVEQRLKWSQVGFVVLLGIMVWALSNDFLRLFGM
jgi:regulator of sigma E protease